MEPDDDKTHTQCKTFTDQYLMERAMKGRQSIDIPGVCCAWRLKRMSPYQLKTCSTCRQSLRSDDD